MPDDFALALIEGVIVTLAAKLLEFALINKPLSRTSGQSTPKGGWIFVRSM
jgi:hypothetical protein